MLHVQRWCMALDIGKERGPRDCVVGFPQEYGEAIFEHTLAQLGKV